MKVRSIIKSWPDSLQYEDGDVLIRFSNHSSALLLLHSQVLRERSDVFERMLSPRWSKPTVLNLAGRDCKVYQLDLVLDREQGYTFLMTKARETLREKLKRALDEPSQSVAGAKVDQVGGALGPDPPIEFMWDNPQPTSILWSYGHYVRDKPLYENFEWYYHVLLPCRSGKLFHEERCWWHVPFGGHQKVLAGSLRVHKTLFTPINGKEVELNFRAQRIKIVRFLVDLLVCADYYGVVHHVRLPLERWALAIPGLYEDIRDQPMFWLCFGRIILSKEIFRGALKHVIGKFYWTPIWSLDERVPDDCRDMAGDAFNALLEEERNLQQRIAEVSAYTPSVPYGHTGGLVELDEQLELLKARDRAWLVIKGIFCSWLTFHVLAKCKGGPGTAPEPNSYHSYAKLYEVARTKDFAAFNHHQPAEEVAEAYALNLDHVLECIDQTFSKLVTCFKEVEAFRRRRTLPQPWEA